MATSIGYDASCAYGSDYGVAIGYQAKVNAFEGIQIGYGTNTTAHSLNVGFYNNSSTHYNWQLLDGTTGLIPDARLSSNIARTSQIPSYNFIGVSFYSTDATNVPAITGDCNAIVNSGHFYYTSNGPSNLGEQSTDGSLYVQAYNQNWVNQIAQDYRTGNIFVRSRNNGTWTAWKAIQNKITSTDVTTALGYSPYNSTNPSGYITGSSSYVASSRFDGQWIIPSSRVTIISSSNNITAGTRTYNLGTTGTSPLNILPNDNYDYEIIVHMQSMYVADTTILYLYSLYSATEANNNYMYTYVITGSNMRQGTNQGTLIVSKNDRNIYLKNDKKMGGYVYLLAYRRIGSNS